DRRPEQRGLVAGGSSRQVEWAGKAVSYKVTIIPLARTVIASWGLSRKMLLAVYARLFGELAADPDQHLGEIVVPLMARAYSFTLPGDGPLPELHHFMFAVDRRDDLGELVILGGRHDTDDTGEN